MSFNLPSEHYWNDNEKLTELREIHGEWSSVMNWSNYKLIEFLYENGVDCTKSIIKQFVYNLGCLSDKQLTIFEDMLLFPMLYVTDEYRYKRELENKYTSIRQTKAERKRIEKNRAELGK